MKILLINSVYSKGSTGNIVSSLHHEYLKNNHDSYVIYGRGNKTKEENVFKICFELESKIHHFISLFTGNMYGGMFLSTFKIKHKIKKIKPDVINLHCINGYFVNIYGLIKYLKRKHIKTVITMHAEFLLSSNCGYTLDCDKWKQCGCKNCTRVKDFNGKFSLNRTNHFYKKLAKSIKNFKELKITSVSPWLSSKIKESPIYKGLKIETINNPLDEYYFNKPSNKPYINDSKNILYVTPDFYEKEKGGQYIELIASKLKDYNFYILSAKDQSYTPINKNVLFIKGPNSKEILLNYYSYADMTLLLSTKETFSMVTIESLASGTPVIGFKAGGPESITNEKVAIFIEQNDIDGLINLIKRASFNKNECSNYAKDKFLLENIAKQYLKFYQ